jgi:predicted naringenin-chalcone synthase
MLEFVSRRFNIRERTRQLYAKVLTNPSILKRQFAVESLDELIDQSLDVKSERFKRHGVALATRALQSALSKMGAVSSDIDYLVSASCTGYLCPGLSSYLVESCGLDSSVHLADLVGMGCGAAIPALEQATNFALAHPGKLAAVVCTEICSAALVSTDEIDIVISNALFADGSAAVLIRASGSNHGLQIKNFAARTLPQWRDELRFVSADGHLKNTLGKQIPEHAAQAVRDVVDRLDGAPGRWILHAGGQKVLDALAKEFHLSEPDLAASRRVLRDHGNMSSATVLFVLDEMMRSGHLVPGDSAVMASFGAGFSAYAALLRWT